MSRATLTTDNPIATGSTLSTPTMHAEPGLEGPYASTPIVTTDARVRAELGRLLEAARRIRPRLRELQGQTEADGQYPNEIHEYFLEHGFYKLLMPQRFGGLELGVPAFFSVISDVARGCPSTAWCLSLSQAHSLTLASYWSERAQAEVFGQHGYMVAPASGNPTAATVEKVDGGYRLSGTWRYCSGAPYSTHFFPTVTIPATETEPEYTAWVVVDRAQYEVLDDWGRVIGMRGSGSNSITMRDAFVPDHHVSRQDWASQLGECTVGYEVHGNPTYNGVFFGFAEGEVAAVSVGLGYAAIDEYERIIRTSKAPYDLHGGKRADADDWRRVLGMAVARVDAASAALHHFGELYEEFGRALAEDRVTFDAGSSMRLNNGHFVVEELVWEALQELIRTCGTGQSADGMAMQRYFRDIWATIGRTDQFQFFAAPSMEFYFPNSSPAPDASSSTPVTADAPAEAPATVGA